jgi:hypothetical protein
MELQAVREPFIRQEAITDREGPNRFLDLRKDLQSKPLTVFEGSSVLILPPVRARREKLGK